MEGKVKLERLVVSKVLRKPVNEYRSMFPHVVAAMQMVQKGKRLRRGETIDFVYINASHTNPFRRVVPALLLDEANYYDSEKYVEMVSARYRQKNRQPNYSLDSNSSSSSSHSNFLMLKLT